jgi:hypothetical protein
MRQCKYYTGPFVRLVRQKHSSGTRSLVGGTPKEAIQLAR